MSKSKRARRAERIARVMDIVGKLEAHTKACDSNWWSRRTDYDTDNAVWLTTPFSVNARGDEPLAESNYRVIKADLERVAGMDIDERGDLWPGGRIDTLLVRADDALALRAVERWIGHLETDGIADDQDYYQEQWDQNHPSIGECYSDDPDCSCFGEYAEQANKLATKLYPPPCLEVAGVYLEGDSFERPGVVLLKLDTTGADRRLSRDDGTVPVWLTIGAAVVYDRSDVGLPQAPDEPGELPYLDGVSERVYARVCAETRALHVWVRPEDDADGRLPVALVIDGVEVYTEGGQ